MNRRPLAVLGALAIGLLAGAPALAAQEESEREIVGSWQGTLNPPGGATLRVVFHVQRDDAGRLVTTLDSPDQDVTGIAVSETTVAGDSVKFVSAAIGGSFAGEWSEDDSQIEGVWRQGGATLPLVLRPGAVEPPAQPPRSDLLPHPQRIGG